MTRFIQLKKHAPSGTIILDRPEKRNALNRAMIDELLQALEDFHRERSVRAVIISGAGQAFCSGMDLQEIQDTTARDDALQQWHADAVQYKRLLEAMLLFPKPIIAAVNGPAVAGGAGLVLGSDLVVACAEANFGFPEPRRGLVAGLVTPLLVFRAGGGRAAQLLLSASLVDAEEARRMGLYHELSSSDMIWARAHQLAEECATSAPESLQLTKRMLNETIGEHLPSQLASGAAASATSRTTEAAREGLAAFLEKRDPQWP